MNTPWAPAPPAGAGERLDVGTADRTGRVLPLGPYVDHVQTEPVLADHAVQAAVFPSATLSPRRRRIRCWFHRYGVPGVSLLRHAMLANQITSAALVSFGARDEQSSSGEVISMSWGRDLRPPLTALGVDPVGNG